MDLVEIRGGAPELIGSLIGGDERAEPMCGDHLRSRYHV